MLYHREQATTTASVEEIKAARTWLRKNFTEVDGWTIGQLGSRSVERYTDALYDGGWAQFLLDTFPPQD